MNKMSVLLIAYMLLACNGQSPASPVAPAAVDTSRLSNAANIAAIESEAALANGTFSFIVIGDNRSGDAIFSQLVQQMNDYAAAQSGAHKPRFVLHTGDIVPSGALSEWDNYAQLRAPLELPMVYVPGNHEMDSADGAANYQGLVGVGNWSFDFGSSRFIGLDDSSGSFSAESVAFLRQQLGLGGIVQAPPQHAFVLFHMPLAVGRWIVHSVKPDSEGGRGGEVTAAITQGGVAAVFLGHLHLHDEMQIDGVPYIISGGGGAPLVTIPLFPFPEHGFLVVHVTPLEVSWEWVSLAQ